MGNEADLPRARALQFSLVASRRRLQRLSHTGGRWHPTGSAQTFRSGSERVCLLNLHGFPHPLHGLPAPAPVKTQRSIPPPQRSFCSGSSFPAGCANGNPRDVPSGVLFFLPDRTQGLLISEVRSWHCWAPQGVEAACPQTQRPRSPARGGEACPQAQRLTGHGLPSQWSLSLQAKQGEGIPSCP